MGRQGEFCRLCRLFVSTSLAIGYIVAYNFLSSNSDAILPPEEMYYADRHNGTAAEVKSLHELHFTEIRERASSIARVYQPSYPSKWCIDVHLKLDQMPGQPMGLCYLRIPHSAGATLKGINMRISYNFPQRFGVEQCIRHDSDSVGMHFANRDKLSYLWTFLRDPTDRAMSVIGSKLSQQLLQSNNRDSFVDATIPVGDSMVSNDPNNDKDIKNSTLGSTSSNILVHRTLDMLQNATYKNGGIFSEGRGGLQHQVCMQENVEMGDVINSLNPTEIVDHSRLLDRVSKTFQKYDFVGLVERFDESLVALQLLLGLESSDVLYFAANRKDEWQRTRVGRRQFVCRKSFDWEVDLVTQPLISNYLSNNKRWRAQNYGDYLFYQAASQSLDQTISKIGPDFFASELKKFRALMKRAHEECAPKSPCSVEGRDQSDESRYDCMEGFACGYRCLDGLID